MAAIGTGSGRPTGKTALLTLFRLRGAKAYYQLRVLLTRNGSFRNEPELRLCRAIAVAAGVVGAALIPIRVSDRPLSSEKLMRL